MDDTEVINQALKSLIDTELVAKQLEQAFKDVCTRQIGDSNPIKLLFYQFHVYFPGNFGQCLKRTSVR